MTAVIVNSQGREFSMRLELLSIGRSGVAICTNIRSLGSERKTPSYKACPGIYKIKGTIIDISAKSRSANKYVGTVNLGINILNLFSNLTISKE